MLWPTLGNHDGHAADSSTQTGPYYDIFTLPTAAEAGGVASGTEAYYSFDYGNIHFVWLDSYESDRVAARPDARPGSRTTWPRPRQPTGSSPSGTTRPTARARTTPTPRSSRCEMRQNALPILEAYGVDLVLTGHSHSYERSFLIDGHYGASSTLRPRAS